MTRTVPGSICSLVKPSSLGHLQHRLVLPQDVADNALEAALARHGQNVVHQLEADAVTLQIGSHHDVEFGGARLVGLVDQMNDADDLSRLGALGVDRRQRNLLVAVDMGEAGRRQVRKILDRAETAHADVFGRGSRKHGDERGLVGAAQRPNEIGMAAERNLMLRAEGAG